MIKFLMWGTFFLGFINPLFFIPFGLYLLSEIFKSNKETEGYPTFESSDNDVIQESFSVNIETGTTNDRIKYISIFPNIGFDITKIYVESGVVGNEDINIKTVDYDTENQKLDIELLLNKKVVLRPFKNLCQVTYRN